MTSGTAYRLWVVLVAVAWIGGGCDRWGGGPGSEEREANYIEGDNLRIQGQTNKAIQSFERALHVNPANANAHVALADLFYNQRDYTSAAYHYSRYQLLIEQRGKTADSSVSNRLESCELQLAVKYSQKLARQQVDNQIDELKRQLAERDDSLRQLQQELARWRPLTNTVPTTNNPAGPPVQAAADSSRKQPSPLTPVSSPPAAATATPASVRLSTQVPAARPPPRPRTYTVRAGDTPAAIAKRYSVTTRALMTANPGVTATRLRPGQVLNLPSP